jgi:hypothetical protein
VGIKIYEVLGVTKKHVLRIRPFSIISTALGCGAFVAALPFTVWSKERMAKVGKALVVNPGKFAFVRPLGEDI